MSVEQRSQSNNQPESRIGVIGGGTMILNNLEFLRENASLTPFNNNNLAFGQSPNSRKMNYFKAILKSRCESNNGSQ